MSTAVIVVVENRFRTACSVKGNAPNKRPEASRAFRDRNLNKQEMSSCTNLFTGPYVLSGTGAK